MKSVRHLIQCRCFLQQFKKTGRFHQFSVFSLIDDDDVVKPKFVQCPNCGIIHRVFEIGKSEILNGREYMNSIVSLDDIKLSLGPRITSVMEKHEIDDVSAWEEVKHIIDNQLWGSFIVLSKEHHNDEMNIKLLKIVNNDSFVVDTETRTVKL